MPVVVVGAESALGRLVVAGLKAEGAEVRALVEKPADDLGVPTAPAEWDDEERIAAVLDGAHTVVAIGGWRQFKRVHAAAFEAAVRRVIVVVGPDEHVSSHGAVPWELVTIGRPRAARWWRRPATEDLAGLAEEIVAADRRG